MNASVVKNEAEKEVATMKIYIVNTKIGTEDKVIADITARLEGAGSMKDKKDNIGKMANPAHLKGYLFVEATEEHYLEAVLGIITTGNSLRIKNVKSIVGESSKEEAESHLRIRKGSEGLEVGMVVVLKDGAWKGEEARIISINETNDTLSLELWGSHVPIPIDNVMANSVRGI
jgi:transcription elongation factor Spt5